MEMWWQPRSVGCTPGVVGEGLLCTNGCLVIRSMRWWGTLLLVVWGDHLGDTINVALAGDGLVLAAGDSGRGTNGRLSGGVCVFRRDGAEWVPMGTSH